MTARRDRYLLELNKVSSTLADRLQGQQPLQSRRCPDERRSTAAACHVAQAAHKQVQGATILHSILDWHFGDASYGSATSRVGWR